MLNVLRAMVNSQLPKLNEILDKLDSSNVSERAQGKIKQTLENMPLEEREKLYLWAKRSLELSTHPTLGHDDKLSQISALNPSEATLRFLRSFLIVILNNVETKNPDLGHLAARGAGVALELMQGSVLNHGLQALKNGIPGFLASDRGQDFLRYLTRLLHDQQRITETPGK